VPFFLLLLYDNPRIGIDTSAVRHVETQLESAKVESIRQKRTSNYHRRYELISFLPRYKSLFDEPYKLAG
jgi:hypothetical protein